MAMNLWGIIKGLLVQDETDRSKELSLEVDPTSTAGTRTTLRSAQTADRDLALPDTSGTLVEQATTDALDGRLTTAESNITDLQGRMDTAETNITQNASDIAAETARAEGAEADEVARATAAEDAIASDLADHIANPTGAHAASAISNTPAGNLVATDVQGALNELQSDVDTRALDSALIAHITNPTGAHAGSAISNTPAGNVTSTNVQAAINELQSHIDVLAPGGGANTALSNLTSTSINQDLNPASNVRKIGSATVSGQWLEVNSLRASHVKSDNSGFIGITPQTAFGNSGAAIFWSGAAADPFFIETANDTTVGTNATNDINIKTGNKSNGVANSGNVILQTGTASGTRGKVKMVDGSEGTIGHVWTQSAIDGAGGWAAPSAKGVQAIVDGRGQNNTSNPNTQMDFSAAQLTLVDSSQNIAVRGSTGTVTNDTTVAGSTANGRDQAGAFANSSWIHFYFIWNGTTLATLSSLSASAPTLPSGYTHKAYIGAVYKDGSGNLVSVTQRGSWFYKNDNALNFAGALSSTSPADVSLATGIPSNALKYQMSYLGILVSNGSGTVDSRLIFYSSGSVQFEVLENTLTGLGASQATTVQKGTIVMPNFNNNLRYAWQIVAGSSPTLVIRLHGYQVPNNGD